MSLSKLLRITGLSLILTVASLPLFAERPCGCSFCSQAAPSTACNFQGTHTTCGEFLSVTLCQPVG